MHFKYCPDCGSRLTEKNPGDEGAVPFCSSCNMPHFDMFPSCIIVLVINEKEEALLLRQNYISEKYCNLVSGYMKPGETAELSAEREVFEETGIKLESIEFDGTYWFDKKGVLMIGFVGRAKKKEFVLSKEVDGAEWVPAERAINMVHPKGSVSHTLLENYLNHTAPL